LDLRNTRFSFSAVIGREDVQDEVINEDRSFKISVEVTNDIGQRIHFNQEFWYMSLLNSDHVWMRNAVPQHSQLITDNLRVIFAFCIENPKRSLFFRSCGFHLQHRH
jgi:hypothetical protein